MPTVFLYDRLKLSTIGRTGAPAEIVGEMIDMGLFPAVIKLGGSHRVCGVVVEVSAAQLSVLESRHGRRFGFRGARTTTGQEVLIQVWSGEIPRSVGSPVYSLDGQRVATKQHQLTSWP